MREPRTIIIDMLSRIGSFSAANQVDGCAIRSMRHAAAPTSPLTEGTSETESQIERQNEHARCSCFERKDVSSGNGATKNML